MPEIKIDQKTTVILDLKEEDFESHGSWMQGNKRISKMWEHKPTQIIFFEDVQQVKDRGLNIYPF